jgi:hypothetical protein
VKFIFQGPEDNRKDKNIKAQKVKRSKVKRSKVKKIFSKNKIINCYTAARPSKLLFKPKLFFRKLKNRKNHVFPCFPAKRE